MTKVVIFSATALVLLAASPRTEAQQVPCNPAIEYCLPVPPEEPPEEGE